MFIESKNEYVSRKVQAWEKEERREHESEGIPLDPDEFRHDKLEVKWAAEDWYDFWDSVTPW